MPYRIANVLLLVIAFLGTAIPCWGQGRAEKSRKPGPVTDRDVTEFLRENNLSKSAEQAIAELRGFLMANELTPAQIQRIEKQLERMEEIRRSGKVRLGGKWVTREEAQEAAVKADQLIQQSFEKIVQQDGKKALELLERACKANPDGIRAYYILGMLFSIRTNCNPYRAEGYFAEVVQRAPDFVPALNNLAICEIKTRKFGEAYAHFRRAAVLSPDSYEVFHNVNRVVSEAEQKQLPVPDGGEEKKKFTTRLDLFKRLAADLQARAEKNGRQFNSRVGWLYMPYIQTRQERDAAPRKPHPPALPAKETVNVVMLSQGTGFAVAPNLLVTNRHVIDDERFGLADVVTVRRPDREIPEQAKPAQVLAVSGTDDLALLKVDGLDCAPIPVSTQPLNSTFSIPTGVGDEINR